jgi:hypothetical protein
MGTIGAVWLLRPDGTLWEVDDGSGRPLTPLAPEWRVGALRCGALFAIEGASDECVDFSIGRAHAPVDAAVDATADAARPGRADAGPADAM